MYIDTCVSARESRERLICFFPSRALHRITRGDLTGMILEVVEVSKRVYDVSGHYGRREQIRTGTSEFFHKIIIHTHIHIYIYICQRDVNIPRSHLSSQKQQLINDHNLIEYIGFILYADHFVDYGNSIESSHIMYIYIYTHIYT